MQTRYLLPVVLLLFALAGCVDGDLIVDSGEDDIPVIGNAPDAFGFTLVATEFSLDEEYVLDFSKDGLSVGLTVASYRGGTGRFELVDAAGEVFFSRDLGRNIAEGTAEVSGRTPAKAVVRLSRYSGVVTIGVAPRQ